MQRIPGEVVVASVSPEASLLDVRERYEADMAPLPGALCVPLGVVLARPETIPRGRRFLVADHDGSRIRFAVRYLREHGVDAVALEGGALAYVRLRS